MGCVSSTFLPDDDRRIIGVSATTTHIVSLTSSTYGILTTLGADADADAEPHKSATPPPPPPPPPPKAEVINSWELMAGLVDPSTPAKSPRSRSMSKRLPLRAIDGNQAQAQNRRCPPGGAQSAVLYTTSLRGVRSTFEACNAVRAALQSHGVAFRERDVSMDRGFREELRGLTGTGRVAVPRLFVRGRLVGGAEEVLRLEEEGALAALLDGLPRARGGRCDGCGGMRFLPCFQCSGSRKLAVAVATGKGKGTVLVRCGDCNENGLVLCPICS